MEQRLYNAFDPALKAAGGKSALPAGSVLADDVYWYDWLNAHPQYTWMDLSGDPYLPGWRTAQWRLYERLRWEAETNFAQTAQEPG